MNATCDVSLGVPHLSSHTSGFSAELFQPEQFGVYSQQHFAGKSQNKAHRNARVNPISNARAPKACYAPVEAPCITSSRVKSTSPDLPLLFSLFDVLLEEHAAGDYTSESFGSSSPSSTSSPLSSEYSENASSPHYEAVGQEGSYPAYAESLSSQWFPTSTHSQIYYDTTHPLLANFVDFD